MNHSGLVTIEELRGLVEVGEVDTVVVAMTDMQGRLQGKLAAFDAAVTDWERFRGFERL